MNILIADDDRNFGWILKAELEEESHTVDLAIDGVEAVLKFLDNSYACVLLDMKMPRLSGTDALKILMKLKPGVPVIVISGNAGSHDMEQAMCLGAKKCLPKPFSFAQLKDDIGRLVAADRAALEEPQGHAL